jgi:hypothetical protein
MLKATIPVSMMTFSTGFNPNKVRFSFAKTKQKLTEMFHAHDEAYQKVKDQPDRELENMHQNVINTAYAIVQVYISEFQKGKVRNGVLRVTRSYIKGFMVGSKLTVKTIGLHINRLLDSMAVPFISLKFRSTLGENTGPENLNTNCIALVLDKQVLQCESPEHQKLFEECLTSKPPKEKPHPLAFLDDPIGDIPMMMSPKQREDAVFMQKPQGIGSVMQKVAQSGDFLKNFGDQLPD